MKFNNKFISAMLKSLFSIKNSEDKKYKIVTLLGIRIKLKRKLSYKNTKNFIKDKCGCTQVLLVEPNRNSHAEVLPGYIYYLLALKYKVDVIISPKQYNEKWLMMFEKNKNVNIYQIDLYEEDPFKFHKLNKYKHIFFTSTVMYKPLCNIAEPTIFEHFPVLNKIKNKILIVEHHLDRINQELLKQNKVIALTDFPEVSSDLIAVNPHYFGDITPKEQKSKITRFIVIGNIEQKRKDFKLLIETAQKLSKRNMTNFEICIAGKRGNLGEIPAEIEKNITFKGLLKFDEMRIEMQKADFFLPLLNSNIEEHLRYVNVGTSGSFQLIYGFLKPCLIERRFAKFHKFDNSNSIIYEDSVDFEDKFKAAIAMNDLEYQKLVKNLEKTVFDIKRCSTENLKNALRFDRSYYEKR